MLSHTKIILALSVVLLMAPAAMAQYTPGGVAGSVSSNIAQVNGATVSTTNPLPVSPNGVAQASIVNVTAAVANTDTTIALGGSFTHCIIKTDTGAAAIYVDLANATATTGDFKVDGGGALTYTGAPITGFHYIGAAVTGNISYLAW